MKHYRIESFVKNEGAIGYRFIINQDQGNYHCPNYPTIEERIKNETDFICEPNSFIQTIVYLRQGGIERSFTIGDKIYWQDALRTIRNIRINKARGEIKFVGMNNWISLNNLPLNNTTEPVNATQNKENMFSKTMKPAPSRSQVKQNSFKELEEKISKATDLRLAKFFKRNLPPTLKEFLIKFFTEYNNSHPTIYVEAKREQTSTGRRRSLGDLYKICKYYYPDMNLHDLVQLLFKDLKEHFKKGFRYSWCSTVQKRVFYYSANSAILEENSKDEYGNLPEYYKSKL